MTKAKKRIFICLIGIFLSISSSFVSRPSSFVYAAVPRLINYQARLADKAGAPLEGSYSLTFKIYDAETAGSLLWEEAHQGVVIQKGVFSVLLGSVTNLNLSFDKPYFLEIKVGSEVMSPRQRIASSAYAIRAEIADNTQLLDGQNSLSYRNASNITTGVLSTAQGGTSVSSVTSNTPNGVCLLDAKGYVPDNSVDTTALKTATSEVSLTGNTYTQVDVTGGQYCFCPQVKMSTTDTQGYAVDVGTHSTNTTSIPGWTSYKTSVGLYAHPSNTIYAKFLYVTSSGEDYWLWLLLDKTSKRVSMMAGASDHPAYGNSNDFNLQPHPFGRNYDPNFHEIILIEKSQAKAIQQEAKEKGLSVLELVDRDYKIDFSQTYPYAAIHSGQYSPDKKPVLVETIPSYIQVRKLVLMDNKDKSEKKKKEEDRKAEYEAKKQQEENRKQLILNKLGITKKEAELLLK